MWEVHRPRTYTHFHMCIPFIQPWCSTTVQRDPVVDLDLQRDSSFKMCYKSMPCLWFCRKLKLQKITDPVGIELVNKEGFKYWPCISTHDIGPSPKYNSLLYKHITSNHVLCLYRHILQYMDSVHAYTGNIMEPGGMSNVHVMSYLKEDIYIL